MMKFIIHKLRNKYSSLSLPKRYILYAIVYSLTFFICFLGAFIYFWINDKSFIWKLDGEPVLYPAFEYVGSYIRETIRSFFESGSLSIKQYDFNLGMGKSILHYLGNWYIEPLALLRMFVPTEYAPSFYNILVIARYYLVGISFSLFAFHKKQPCFSALIGSMVYVFSYYTLYTGVKFPVFLVPMIYLPLMLVGMDRLLYKRKPCLLVFMVFLSAWTHYYYFVINTLFLGIYFIIEFFRIEWKKGEALPENIKLFLKQALSIICTYLFGALMAAVVFIPNILIFVNSNRTAPTLNIENLFWYGRNYFKNLWLYFSFPIPTFSIGYEAYLGLLPISALVIIAILFRKKYLRHVKVYLIIGIGCLLLPICSYILCGFSNINNRWIYGFIFVVSYSTCRILPYFKRLSEKVKGSMLLFLLLYGFSLYTFFCENRNEYTQTCMILLCCTTLFFFYGRGLKKSLFRLGLWGIMVCSIFIFGYYLNSPMYMNYTKQFMDQKDVRETIINVPASAIGSLDDDSFYRIDTIEPTRYALGSSVLLGYNGIGDYSNVFSTYMYDYMIGNRNAGLQENIMNYDLDGRSYLTALASVKYVSCQEDMKSYIPYGFTEVLNTTLADGSIGQLYQNKYALPLGYTYENYILESDYNKQNALDKQELTLNAVVLENKLSTVDPVSCSSYKCNNAKLDFEVTKLHNIQRSDNTYTVLEGGGYITIKYNGKPKAETYLYLENLNITENLFIDWTWQIDNGTGKTKTLFLMSDKNYYRPNTHDYMINLGYAKTPQNTCTIYIPSPGKFSLDEIQVLYQSLENYEQEIQGLSKDVLENVEEKGDYIYGDITLDTDKILCFSIPYDKGWAASVDGKEVPLLRANVAYMAIPLSAGYHQIELHYSIPGVKAGLFLTIIFSSAFIVYCIRNIVRYRMGNGK